MTSDRIEKPGRADTPDVLDLALEQSHEVKAKVETCADDLAAANENMKAQIAGGTTVLSAHKTLRIRRRPWPFRRRKNERPGDGPCTTP